MVQFLMLLSQQQEELGLDTWPELFQYVVCMFTCVLSPTVHSYCKYIGDGQMKT